MSDFHQAFPNGGKGKRMKELLTTFNSLESGCRCLDYGCGKGGTIAWLKDLRSDVEIDGYDPGVEQYAVYPEGVEYGWLYTVDVLEHLTTSEIWVALERFASHTGIQDHIIDLDPAKKSYPDGTNAHKSLFEPSVWETHFLGAGIEPVNMEILTDSTGRRRLWITA